MDALAQSSPRSPRLVRAVVRLWLLRRLQNVQPVVAWFTALREKTFVAAYGVRVTVVHANRRVWQCEANETNRTL